MPYPNSIPYVWFCAVPKTDELERRRHRLATHGQTKIYCANEMVWETVESLSFTMPMCVCVRIEASIWVFRSGWWYVGSSWLPKPKCFCQRIICVMCVWLCYCFCIYMHPIPDALCAKCHVWFGLFGNCLLVDFGTSASRGAKFQSYIRVLCVCVCIWFPSVPCQLNCTYPQWSRNVRACFSSGLAFVLEISLICCMLCCLHYTQRTTENTYLERICWSATGQLARRLMHKSRHAILVFLSLSILLSVMSPLCHPNQCSALRYSIIYLPTL